MKKPCRDTKKYTLIFSSHHFNSYICAFSFLNMRTLRLHNLLSLLLLLIVLFSACTQEEDNMTTGKIIQVGLQVNPSLEHDSQPLSRAAALEDGLYAINVLWKKNNAFQPYATGLFNDISNVNIGLIEGYTYRFDCTFLKNDELCYNADGYYGLPFTTTAQRGINAVVTNKLIVSINPLNENKTFHQHIYKGAVHLKADSINEHPTNIHRFYGSETLDLTSSPPATGSELPISLSIELKRAYYTLRFATENLSEGDSVRIEMTDAQPFYIKCENTPTPQSEERLFSLRNIASILGGGINSEETLPINVYFRPKDAEDWTPIIDQSIKVQRNKRNRIKIINIDKHYKGDTSISFEGDSNQLDPTTETEGTLG